MGCNGPLGSARPSMVSTSAPSICQTNTVHAFTALPLMCTTHAPHCDVSQPTWVPVSRRFSRRNCTSSVRGSTSPVTALPFTVRATAVMAILLRIAVERLVFRVEGRFRQRIRSNRHDLAEVHGSKSTLNCRFSCPSAASRYRSRELHEEIVRCFLRRAVDQSLSELRQLAADLRLHVIGKKGAAVLVRERDRGAAFCEPRDAPLPFAGNTVAVRRIEIRKPYFPLPARLDWADLHGRDSLELVVRDPVELLTARNAALEHFGIVELGPDDFPGRGKLDLPIHGHRHRLVLPLAGPRIKPRRATRKVLCRCPGRTRQVTVGSLHARPATAERKPKKDPDVGGSIPGDRCQTGAASVPVNGSAAEAERFVRPPSVCSMWRSTMSTIIALESSRNCVACRRMR